MSGVTSATSKIENRQSIKIFLNALIFCLFFFLDKKERKNQAQTKLSPRAQKTMKTRAK
jgi:hypothetical protein